ncbi:unnamed protein product [Blepharisma stoltei]|uniref:EF-hand domain-containing protein n=1 Tax=Blepharisma stoltei TaxID=1481888 RepID=A0AAU9IL52_9CILI|nr:unnamed protein product [Blepharisma stoltei]
MDWKYKLPSIQNRLRFQLFSRRYDGMERVYHLFSESDRDQSGSLDRYEFEAFLSKVGLFLTTQEQSELFRYYDKNHDGQISVTEFLSSLQSEMSEQRLSAVKAAFQFLDTENRGSVPIERLQRLYRANRHPRVLTREKTIEQVTNEFNSALSRYSDNGIMSEDGFLAYHASLSATIPTESDEYFTNLLVETWGVNFTNQLSTGRTLENLEEILNEKIRQRTSSSEDEGKSVLRTFNYVDKDSSGAITYQEFKQALDQWGCAFSDDEARALFDNYDRDKSGYLLIEEFAQAFATRGAAGCHQFNGKREPPNSIIDKIRKDLLRRGFHGIRSLGLVFKRLDITQSGVLTKNDFEWGLRDNGHFLNQMDLDRLFNYFDKNRNSRIQYNNFIAILRGDLSQGRKQLVSAAYQKLSNNGVLRLEDLRANYDPGFHPEAKSGRKSREQVLSDFISQWPVPNQAIISAEDFESYYKDVSLSYSRDDEFENMIRSAWHMEILPTQPSKTLSSMQSTQRNKAR